MKTVLEPNTQLHYTLSTSNDIYNVKIELDTTYPSGGKNNQNDSLPLYFIFSWKAFAAVSLGNGKFALGFNEVVDRNRFSSISTYFIQMSLAVPQSNPGLTSQEVTIVTNNNVLASDTAVFQ